MDDLVELLAVRAAEKGLALGCAITPEAPLRLRGDPDRLRQILLNLAGNALKFTDQGRVAIGVSVESETPSQVCLRFSVSDTGIGIPADKLECLFAKFSQVDSSTTRLYGGTGLGLALSKQLAELMGGRIGVESQPGKGSQFWFTVRLDKQPGADGKSLASSPRSGPLFRTSPGVPPPRVLVAEDNITNQEVLQSILRKMGLDADVAANGAEVVDALQRQPYDLVLMDVQMPGMDGLQAVRLVRNPESAVLNHHIPVVAMTAHAMEGDRQECLRAGMDDYLAKPIRIADLVAALEKWIRPASPGPEPAASPVADAAPAALPGAPPLVFDRESFLRRSMDDEALARHLIEGFLADLPRQIAQLKTHGAAGEPGLVKELAHRIRGAALTMGGEALGAAAEAVRLAATTPDAPSLPAGIEEMERRFAELASVLAEAMPPTARAVPAPASPTL